MKLWRMIAVTAVTGAVLIGGSVVAAAPASAHTVYSGPRYAQPANTNFWFYGRHWRKSSRISAVYCSDPTRAVSSCPVISRFNTSRAGTFRFRLYNPEYAEFERMTQRMCFVQRDHSGYRNRTACRTFWVDPPS